MKKVSVTGEWSLMPAVRALRERMAQDVLLGAAPTGEAGTPACLDCGKPYASFPLDVILPRPQWLEIHPDEHGLLCANCIVARAALVPGSTCCHLIIEITPPRVRFSRAEIDRLRKAVAVAMFPAAFETTNDAQDGGR